MEVFQESIQLCSSTWPDNEGIIHISESELWLSVCGHQCRLLKVFHEESCYHWGKRCTHSCSFCLFIELVAMSKVCGFEAQLCQWAHLFWCHRSSFTYGLIMLQTVLHNFDRDLCKEALHVHVKANEAVIAVNLQRGDSFHKVCRVFHKRAGTSSEWWHNACEPLGEGIGWCNGIPSLCIFGNW